MRAMRTVTELIEFVLDFPESGAGGYEALAAYAEIREVASESDLPELLAALESEKGDFWSREMLAEPIAEIGGLPVVEPLLVAYRRNAADGHDNDTFSHTLYELFTVGDDPKPELRRLASAGTEISAEAMWWLEEGLA